MPEFMIYGANGFTGSLIAAEAARRGMRPILAGRNADKLAALADKLGLEHRVFGLDEPVAVDTGLHGVSLVLHCAGPFSKTSNPVADACLRMKVHYLDITGEEAVFEALAARDAEAKAAGIVLLPGVGFGAPPGRYEHIVFAMGLSDRQVAMNPIVTLNHDYTRPPIGRSLGRKFVKDGVVRGSNRRSQAFRRFGPCPEFFFFSLFYP
jgi:Saccharopine dehydrogenase NADP binding domain